MKKEEIITILKKYKIIIILVGLTLIYFLIVTPLVKKWKDTNKRINYLENKLINGLPYLEEEIKVNGLYDTLMDMMDIKIEDKHVEEIKTELYDMLSRAANKYNVVIKRYRPTIKKLRGSTSEQSSKRSSRYSSYKKKETSKTKQSKYSIIINLDLEAKLPDFVRFAYYIENSPYLMQVREANFTPLPENKMRISIEIEKIAL